MNCEF